ncbi:MinD/ParA family ATP-binding protein [Specibacter cremeus]|uniref:MinD/ParA family ATP-binding protein n=1 Tax=Specibacter cremeus TaxID=1629051 RepID=UPI001F0C683F|nr:MinD/ParA family protein [Specibacter cremeus]
MVTKKFDPAPSLSAVDPAGNAEPDEQASEQAGEQAGEPHQSGDGLPGDAPPVGAAQPATVPRIEVVTPADAADGTVVDPAGTGPLGLAAAAGDPASTGSVGQVASVVPDPPEVPPMPTTTAAAPDWVPTGAPVPPAPADGPATVPANGEAGHSPRRQRDDGPEPAAALTPDRLLAKSAAPPVGGWRLLLYRVSFGAINLGDSDKVRLRRAMENTIATRLGDRTRYVPVLSRKGGVGKTTVTTLLGMALADMREDRVIAMDANPDRGTLSDRSPGRADFTARNLVKDRFEVSTFPQLSNYVARDGSRLDVLASDTDPAVAQAFDDADYRAVTDILGKYYSIVLTDSGTGMVHSVMKGTLEKADTVVLVSGGSVDEARLASETLSWLEAHGRHDLVARAIVVINLSGGETQVDIDEIEGHFRSRVDHVLRLPYDKHLAEGSRIQLARLRPATQAAVVELAALVVGELVALPPKAG